jgi:hypothetical protein
MNRTLDDHLQERFRHVLSGLSVFQFPFYYRVGPHFNLVRDLLRQLTNFTVSDFMLQVRSARRGLRNKYDITLRPTDQS